MAKRGRPSKYETHVKSRFEEITKWVKAGATEKEIWTNLYISKSRFYEYKSKFQEFKDLLKNNRTQPVEDIKAAMLKRAIGFQYTEKKKVSQYVELPDEIREYLPEEVLNSMNSPKLVRIEETIKTALPDVAAGLVLLQHWDKDKDGKTKWSRDPAQLELKQKEFELKKEQAENENW